MRAHNMLAPSPSDCHAVAGCTGQVSHARTLILSFHDRCSCGKMPWCPCARCDVSVTACLYKYESNITTRLVS